MKNLIAALLIMASFVAGEKWGVSRCTVPPGAKVRDYTQLDKYDKLAQEYGGAPCPTPDKSGIVWDQPK